MGYLKSLLFLVLPVLLSGCCCTTPSFPEGSVEKLVADHLQPLICNRHIVGASIGVLRHGEITTLGLGEVRWKSDQTPDADTLYEIGSITKTVTGVLMALAEEDGLIEEDTLLKTLLPPEVTVPAYDGQEITLAHLATHTSALPRVPDNATPADRWNPYADYTAEQLYAFLGSYSLPRAPGAEYEYSNLGAGLLGYALSLRMGGEYEGLLRARILGPLGMQDSAVTLAAAQLPRLAQGYSDFLGIGRLAWPIPAKNWDMSILAGAGALRSTVNDLLKYMQAHIEPPDSALGRAIIRAQAERFRIDEQMWIGLFWHGLEAEGMPLLLAHNGETGGYRSFIGFCPGENTGLIILSNTAYNFEGEALGLLQALLTFVPAG